MENDSKILKLRRIQTIVSMAIFFIVFFCCWFITGFKITEIQLSNWGTTSSVGSIWNAAVCLLSVSIFINVCVYIFYNPRMKYKKLAYCLFGLVSSFLFIVGMFDASHFLVHNVAAYLYFFSYPLVIFIINHLNKNYILYKNWLIQLVSSILMIILPLLFLWQFNGMAISEIAHTSIVVIWNLYLVFKKN